MKEFLSREGHPFEARNVEDDDAAYDELMRLGARSVPVTVFAADHADHAKAADHVHGADGANRAPQVVIGFDQARLRAALTAAGGGSSPNR